MNGKAADNGIPVGTGAARKAAPFAGAKVIGKSARTATETETLETFRETSDPNVPDRLKQYI